MSDYTKTGQPKQIQPTKRYPRLLDKLARVSILVQDLHDELTDENLAEVLEVTKQAVTYKKKMVREKYGL